MRRPRERTLATVEGVEAADGIVALDREGVRVAMGTGDITGTDDVGWTLCIGDVRPEVLPAGKAEGVRDL